MQVDKDTQNNIQELQVLEQNLQTITMQKQAFQAELGETENALTELSKTKQEAYKIIGQIMIKADNNDLQKELNEKKELVSLRLKTLEQQEASLVKSTETLREKVLKQVEKK
tara:strand:- start:33 stop:368 length:336 start_codon:yes stop_codon:yes gene_type:complete